MSAQQKLSKVVFAMTCSLALVPAFAGELGSINSEPVHRTYAAITVGDYSSLYQDNYTHYTLGVMDQLGSFNNTNNDAFGQFALGRDAMWGTLPFDHQLIVSKLGGTMFVPVGTTNFSFSQRVDFGYDFMPKISLWHAPLEAYGLLGVHYGQFVYKKTDSEPVLGVTFDNTKNQIGFSIGAGLRYQLWPELAVGVKYQYLQYGSTNVYGTNSISSYNEIEQFTPSFNLVGIELRYNFA